MKQRKQPQKARKTNSLQDYLNTYDAPTLVGLLNSLENSDAWNVFMAYSSMVQRQYEIEALDAMGKEGSVKSAAFASGYAKGVEDVSKLFMLGLKNTVNKVSQVVENPPEVDVM